MVCAIKKFEKKKEFEALLEENLIAQKELFINSRKTFKVLEIIRKEWNWSRLNQGDVKRYFFYFYCFNGKKEKLLYITFLLVTIKSEYIITIPSVKNYELT